MRSATSNRAFLGRAVAYLLDQGITQFLDLGSGIPAGGNVHEAVQRRDLGARVAYVDYDEVAVAHSRVLLRDNPLATMIEADLRRPDEVLSRPEIRNLIDFDKPVGLVTLGVVHFVAEDHEARDLVDRYRRALPRGSFLALSHFTADHKLQEMASVFDGFDLVEPGVVSAPDWRPRPDEAQTASTAIYAIVGRL